ncbi:bacillithiol biosynthesis deacetylase BshB2 [Cytobacillus dafuensis]|uniref:Bacillithiol biosynthesis deacetylase BshB2 n=1 Tax=Cytobacillus dafuensis TaxID=1742359 RepID=A0A5B8ZAB3_CYTDA|nr:bacillithiol biosynthesis deacetylase BshB2 [Cytobacillus dafuensis]QED49797.1 bacillithiol biosynthesis deacetylase BshB2 [Cytobacillus dafuensis]
MEKERHVLVVFPHPDDEAFGVSGTIASYTQNGTPVTYACLTLGEMGRNMGNPPFATRESLSHIRKKELQDAANILGITDLRMLGYRDKTVEFENEEVLASHMSAIIKDVNPSLVITFYPGYSVHPDHDACGAAVIRAVKEMPAENRPKVHCVAFSHNCEEEIGQADIVNHVAAYANQKLAAIKAHVSQTQLMVSQTAINLENQDPEVIARFHYERFWTYPF